MKSGDDPVLTAVRRLFPAGGRALVALSGGADSVALLAAMTEAGVECHAIHCNYHLRGAESDRDEAHSRSTAGRLGADITVIQCDVDAYRRRHPGLSVEMACREMRYDAFREAARRLGIDAVAVGHHVEDDNETLILNLLRGSGLKGLKGMELRRGNILRPLLGVTRADILAYLQARGLDYVVDSSNLSCDYRRNAVRNAILPLVREHFPQADKGLAATRSSLAAQMRLLDDFLTAKSAEYVDCGGAIAVGRIVEREAHPAELLFELLNRPDYRGYTVDTVDNIVASADKSGLEFHGTDGSSYRLEYGVLRPIVTTSAAERRVDDLSAAFRTEIITRDDFRPGRDPDVAYFDADALAAAGPFTLRHPRRGDRLAPFGMKGTRLLSDIFTDLHTPHAARRAAVVVADSAGRIIWLPGIRASRHHPVAPSTLRILKVYNTTSYLMMSN